MSIITNTLYDCYDYIIGLYRGNCECFDPKGDYTLDYNTSLSDLYLNELHPINNLLGLENCENSDVWALMDRARTRAIINFVTDASSMLSQEYKLAYQPYSGVIGRIQHKKDRAINTTYAGVVLRCNPINSGYLTLSSIGALFNFTGNITVSIYNNLDDSNFIGSYTLNTVEDTFTNNIVEELELPLYSEYTDYLEYYFIYTVGANQPRNNDLSCNCGSFKPYYNLHKPYYTMQKPKEYGWANYVMVGGVDTDNLDFMSDTPASVGTYMNGLTLGVDFRCKVGETLCKDALDFVGDPVAGSIAHAIWYKAGCLLADMLMTTGEINRQTMINREQLGEYYTEWLEKYNEKLDYIARNIDMSKSDCFTCRDHYHIHRAGIRL